MKVLFLYPSIDCPPGINHGLAAISGVLRAHGHATSLLHVSEELGPLPSEEDVVLRARAERPGLLAFSAMTQQYEWCRRMSRALRAALPETPQVVGGVHCTMVPDDVTADGLFDYVCVGEGEWAMLELVRRLEAGLDPTSIPNLRMQRDGKTIVNPVGPFPDLTQLPPKDYALFDMDRILDAKDGWLSLLTSRGCPYKCTYCFNKEIVDRYRADGALTSARGYLRHYPTERILGEIRALRDRHPQLKTIIFDDDLFTLNRAYVHEFTRAYKQSGLGLPYVVNAHVQNFNDDLAFDLHDSGCRIVKFGLESGSDEIRQKVLQRFMSNRRMIDAFASAHRYHLHTSAFVMMGFPHEHRHHIEETIDLCARIGMGRFRWALFFPYPGTEAYRISREAGLIDEDRMARMGNYFDGTCLRFGEEHDLYLEKLAKVFHWYVNARTDWPAAERYRLLVEEVDGWDRTTWERRREDLHARDRDLSDELMSRNLLHYTIRYSRVMGVRSDFIQWEQARARRGPAAT